MWTQLDQHLWHTRGWVPPETVWWDEDEDEDLGGSRAMARVGSRAHSWGVTQTVFASNSFDKLVGTV